MGGERPGPGPLGLALLAVALSASLFWLDGNVWLEALSDEGFLWYGTIRTSLGEVPLRDFQSYDPGRYYWGAAWFKLLGGRGILALRLSATVFFCVGLGFGLLALRRVFDRWWSLALSGLVLVLWMYPFYKAYEITISLGAVFFAVRLIERPSLTRHFAAGLFAGAAAWFGRNLGLYCALAFLTVVLIVQIRIERGSLLRRLGVLGAGAVLGYAPMLLMFLLAPGLFDTFVEMNKMFVQGGVTNLSRPVPWPWKPQYSYFKMSAIRAARFFTIGLFFVVLPLFQAAMAAVLLFKKDLRRRALLLASTAVGISYIHYAFSRADLPHLASSIHPLLLAMMALPCSFERLGKRLPLVAWLPVLLLASIFAVGTDHPAYRKAAAEPGRFLLRRMSIAGDQVWLSLADKDLLKTMRRIKKSAQAETPGDEPLFISPIFPGLYPALELKNPVWQLTFLGQAGLTLPDTRERQEAMIAELARKKVAWAIVCDIALDRRDELRFSRTYGYLWRHFMEDWTRVERLSKQCEVRHRIPPGERPASRPRLTVPP